MSSRDRRSRMFSLGPGGRLVVEGVACRNWVVVFELLCSGLDGDLMPPARTRGSARRELCDVVFAPSPGRWLASW